MNTNLATFDFDEFLTNLSLSGYIQSYFFPEKSFKIFMIDTIDSRILLSIDSKLCWFTEIDFIFGKVCV